ncbi:MAG: PGPGW domain-containing protein [Gammaproteobacteria bacterium]|nr:PGPGW domain-containing protein [Gammaproteobacteria bacterium]MCP5139422.1 PGPGW domain-containing protein [Chromatiales bacterium]
MISKITDISYRLGRQIVIAVIGGTLLLGGVIMLVTPGPGLAAMLAGLAVLAIEFAWARIWLKKLRESVGPVGQAAERSWMRWRQRFFGPRDSGSDTGKK